MNDEPLKDWKKTVLSLRVLDGPMIELAVWHPMDIPNKERVALLAKHAAQGVRLIRALTGTKELIVQGQYAEAES